MAIPKKVLQQLLEALSLSRLKSLCKFAWASKCETKEHFVNRYSTKTCVYTICDRLTHNELRRFAEPLGVDSSTTVEVLRDAVKDAVWNYSGRNTDTSATLKVCLEKNRNLKKVFKLVWSKCDTKGWGALCQAEQIFVASMLVAEEIWKKSISFETMLFPYTEKVPSDWPKPITKSLKAIGATKSAALIEAWILAAGLKGLKGAKFIERLDDEVLDRSGWTAKWKANSEDIASLMKAFLLKSPKLF